MDAERWKHVERVLQLALDLPLDEHDAFLKRRCAGDVALEQGDAPTLLLRENEPESRIVGTQVEAHRLLATVEERFERRTEIVDH
jgi:hypothetical protein